MAICTTSQEIWLLMVHDHWYTPIPRESRLDKYPGESSIDLSHCLHPSMEGAR